MTPRSLTANSGPSEHRAHRYYLVRCSVRNRADEPGVRFVEHQYFRLWQYLMANKHAITVVKAGLWLWIPEEQLHHQPSHLLAGRKSEPVSLLRFELYDPANQVMDSVQRFVPSEDLDVLQERLLARVPASIQQTPNFSLASHPGRALAHQLDADMTRLGEALADSLTLSAP